MSSRRCRSIAIIAAAMIAFACANPTRSDTDAIPHGRLPQGVRPIHYELELTIDPTRERFSGIARIRIELEAPTRTIWLHGEQLSVAEVTIAASNAAMRSASWEDAAAPGIAAIHLPLPIGPGMAELTIAYDAAFGEYGRGLYRIDSGGDAYAFTHFEPLSARRAFPGFDEPRFETRFDVTLVVSAEDVAAAISPILEESDLDGRRRRIHFAPTPPLPTYLIAWAVGPLDVTPVTPLPARANRERPLPLRGIAVRGGGAELTAPLA